jgi:hypothetical protein
MRKRRNQSGVLLGTEVALVFDAFRAYPTLVVFAVRWRVGRNAVLPRWIGS